MNVSPFVEGYDKFSSEHSKCVMYKKDAQRLTDCVGGESLNVKLQLLLKKKNPKSNRM